MTFLKKKKHEKGREREGAMYRSPFFHFWAHLSKVCNYVSLSLVAQLGEKNNLLLHFSAHTHLIGLGIETYSTCDSNLVSVL